MKKFFLFIFLLLGLLILVLFINLFRFQSKQLSKPGKRLTLVTDTAAVNHLSKAIKFQTISYDFSEPGTMADTTGAGALTDAGKHLSGWHTEIHSNVNPFDSLFEFFEATYPLTFQSLSVKRINNSMLLHWKGGSSNKKPVILYAHLDVVPPYGENDTNTWKKEPFSGEVDENFIYGRGAIDDKGSAIAILESTEKLISEKFIPSRDLYIAFGHDEEIGGEDGAKMMAAELQKAGVRAEFILDEGGLVAVDMVPFVEPPVAIVFTSEKGYMTLQLTVTGEGGHSGFPPKEAPVEILASAIRKIHEHPFEPRITKSVSDFMDYTGPEMKFPYNLLFANRWLFSPVILNEYSKFASGNATIRTTSVATMIEGGTKENVVPVKVSAKINFRNLPGDNSEDVIQYIRKTINDDRVSINLVGQAKEASGISSIDAEGYKILNRVIQHVFPDAIVAPSLLIAQTDSRHFVNVVENIYRFNPVRMNDDILSTMHGKDERIGIKDFMESIEFYKNLIKQL